MDVDYSSFPSDFTKMDLMAMLTEMEKPSLQALSQFASSTAPAPAPLYFNNAGITPSFYAPSSGAVHDHMIAPAVLSNSVQGGAHVSAAAVREMAFRIAAMQPMDIDPASVRPPKRRNVRISKDPQSVAARHRRERISERIRILQRLVPGGTKMDTASMLEEAIHYLKFLKDQVQSLEQANAGAANPAGFSPEHVNGRLSSGNSMPWGMNL